MHKRRELFLHVNKSDLESFLEETTQSMEPLNHWKGENIIRVKDLLLKCYKKIESKIMANMYLVA